MDIRANTATTITVGPFVDLADGFTPETSLTAGGVDEIGVYKHEATALTDLSGTTTFTHRAGGMYTMTLSATDTNTVGRLDVYVRDDSVALPVALSFNVMAEGEYDNKYGDPPTIPATVDTATNTHTPTVTEFQCDDITEATADHFVGRTVRFTSGACDQQTALVISYAAVGGIGQFTVTPMTDAPSNNDTLVIEG